MIKGPTHILIFLEKTNDSVLSFNDRTRKKTSGCETADISIDEFKLLGVSVVPVTRRHTGMVLFKIET